MQERSDRDIVAFFGALCLFLSTIEYLVPKPMPFIRLGLANIPILLSMRFFKVSDVFLVVLLKVLGQGFVNGTFASYVFLFSFSGSMASLLVMLAVRYMCAGYVSIIGISLSGSLASGFVQVILSVVFIFGGNARVMAPYFIGSSFITGLLVGFFAHGFAVNSRWLLAVEKKYGEGRSEASV